MDKEIGNQHGYETFSEGNEIIQELDKAELSADAFLQSKNIIASSDPTVMGTKAQTGEELKSLCDADKKLKNKLKSKLKSKLNEPLLKWNNFVFYAQKKDITQGNVDINKAQRFALEALHDMERTHVGKFMLQQLNSKYQGNKYITIDMNAGIPTGSKELKSNDEQAIIDGRTHEVEQKGGISRSRGDTGGGGHSGSSITWPFEYARYHYRKNEEYNKDPESPRIASSPSEVLFHEFGHLFDRFKFVKKYLKQAKLDGIQIDANQNGQDDITEDGGKKPFLEAEHTGGMGSQTATYMEQIFILQKNNAGFTNHNPRPKYGTHIGRDVVERIGVKVNHADQIAPIEEEN